MPTPDNAELRTTTERLETTRADLSLDRLAGAPPAASDNPWGKFELKNAAETELSVQEKIDFVLAEMRKDSKRDLPKITEVLQSLSDADLVKLCDIYAKENSGKRLGAELKKVVLTDIQDFPDADGNYFNLGSATSKQLARLDQSYADALATRAHDILAKPRSEWTAEERETITGILETQSKGFPLYPPGNYLPPFTHDTPFAISIELSFRKQFGEPLSKSVSTMRDEMKSSVTADGASAEDKNLFELAGRYLLGVRSYGLDKMPSHPSETNGAEAP